MRGGTRRSCSSPVCGGAAQSSATRRRAGQASIGAIRRLTRGRTASRSRQRRRRHRRKQRRHRRRQLPFPSSGSRRRCRSFSRHRPNSPRPLSRHHRACNSLRQHHSRCRHSSGSSSGSSRSRRRHSISRGSSRMRRRRSSSGSHPSQRHHSTHSSHNRHWPRLRDTTASLAVAGALLQALLGAATRSTRAAAAAQWDVATAGMTKRASGATSQRSPSRSD